MMAEANCAESSHSSVTLLLHVAAECRPVNGTIAPTWVISPGEYLGLALGQWRNDA